MNTQEIYTVGNRVRVTVKGNTFYWVDGKVSKVSNKWVYLTDCYRSADRWVLRDSIVSAYIVPDYTGCIITTQCY